MQLCQKKGRKEMSLPHYKVYYNVIDSCGIKYNSPREGMMFEDGDKLSDCEYPIDYYTTIHNGEFTGNGYILFISKDRVKVAIWTMGSMSLAEVIHNVTRI